MRTNNLNRRTRRDKPLGSKTGPRTQWYARKKHGGIGPAEIFTGGIFLKNVPKAMYDPKSTHRKVLELMAHLRDTTGDYYTEKELKELYLDNFDVAIQHGTLAPIIGSFATMGLLERIAVNRKTGKWRLKDNINVNNTLALVKLCKSNLKKLKRSDSSEARRYGGAFALPKSYVKKLFESDDSL